MLGLTTEFFELRFSEDQLGFLRIWNLSIALGSHKEFANAMSGIKSSQMRCLVMNIEYDILVL